MFLAPVDTNANHSIDKRALNMTFEETMIQYINTYVANHSAMDLGEVLPVDGVDRAAQAAVAGVRPTPPAPNSAEVAFLIIVASIGMIGNFGIIVVILVLSSLRRASNAFLFHQSALDFLKSAYCLPFAQTLVGDTPEAFCSVLGGSYIVFVTTSAFNMLAMVMNEAYQFADLTLGVKDSRNYCCVFFGIFIIWFSSIIMNLGVAFIPGNPSYDRQMGHCIFVYGVTRNYVLHVLWIVLITLAVSLTITYLHKLHQDIKRSAYYRMTTLIRATVTIDTHVRTASQRRQSEFKEKHHIKQVQKITRRKLYLLILLITLFILFWYPLFTLSATDPNFKVPPKVYKALTMFAWSNSTFTPIIIFFFIKTVCCCSGDDPSMPTCDAAAPEEERSTPNRQTESAREECQRLAPIPPPPPPECSLDERREPPPRERQLHDYHKHDHESCDHHPGTYNDYTHMNTTQIPTRPTTSKLGPEKLRNKSKKSVSLWI